MRIQKIHSRYNKKKMHISRGLYCLMGILCCLILLMGGRSSAYAQDAKHIILLIADGWGPQHIEATKTYTGDTPIYQSDPAWVNHWMSTFPYGGSYNTTQAWSVFNYVMQGTANSANASTALYSGSKTSGTRISVTPDGSARLYTIGEKAKSLGKAVGAITTVPVSDATPGAFCAHNDARGNTYAIADECLFGDPNTTGTIANDPKYAGGHGPTTPSIDVLIGDRTDGYINDAIRDKLFTESGQPGKHFFVERQAGADGGDALLAAANNAAVNKLAGLFDFIYRHDPAYSAENPTLAESTIAALTVLQKNPNGFILMIEGGAVDWAAHENNMDLMIGEMTDFNEAVQAVIDWVDDPADSIDWSNTLVIVTGDHEAGYLTAGPGIFQNQPLGEVSDPTLALEKIISGSEGEGRRASWDDLDGDSVIDAGETVYWAWNSGSHTNTLLPLYARGAGADQLETYAIGYDTVRGYYLDNTDVFSVMDSTIGNLPPTANNDTATTDENTPVNINVIANDTDSNGTIDPATVAITGNPANGTAVAHTDGTVTYTPDTGFDGTDTFTYTVNDNEGATSNQATVTVTVINTFTITGSAPGGHGTISCVPSTVNSGGSSTCTMTPDATYYLSALTDNGANVLGSVVNNTYTITNVTANHTISASFAMNTFTVTPSVTGSGTISPSTPQTVNYNQTTQFTVTPNTGYYIASVTGTCGGSLAGNTYTTNAVTANCTVIANFTINTFTVTPSAGAGGSMNPSTPQTVNYNQTTSFTVTPNANYHIVSVTGCSGTLAGNTYTTGPITADCTVTATFAINTFTVTPSVTGSGTISPSTPQTVNYNQTTSFTVTPIANYHVASVTGCSGTLAGNTYTTGPITADCTVTATFAINTYTVTPSIMGNGSINPSTPQTLSHGSTTSFTVTPNTGYRPVSVTGCGGAWTGTNPYTTGSITDDCTVTATFAANTGNVNGDNNVDIVDALLVARYAAGLPVNNFIPEAGDVNCDGKVDIVDALLLSRKAAGLPVPNWCSN